MLETNFLFEDNCLPISLVFTVKDRKQINFAQVVNLLKVLLNLNISFLVFR